MPRGSASCAGLKEGAGCRQIWVRAFSAESVAAALGVPAAALPDLAALLGNDITTEAVQVLPRGPGRGSAPHCTALRRLVGAALSRSRRGR